MADPTLSKKRYVLLADAGRISGYTNEYVSRLCRIGKIPCRMMGEKTIVELDSLLSQTGTILLGGEHVGFIDVAGDTSYPAFPVDSKASEVPETHVATMTTPHSGHIAVVGAMARDEDNEKHVQKIASVTPNEKFPSNALPFFSSMAKGGGKGGFHIPVSNVGVAHLSVLTGTPSTEIQKVKQPMHIAVTKEGETPTTPIKSVTVMPQTLPAGFTPIVPMTAPTTPLPTTPLPVVMQSVPASGGASPLYDHDLDQYSSKLPMLLRPTSLVGKSLFAVFAVGLLVLPSALGVGNFLDRAIQDVGGSFRSSGRMMMAAVGLINPNRDTTRFPHLLETSQLLSATAVSGGSAQTGIVVTPSSGSPETDAQIKDAIQKTFSTPVDVVPDGKGSRTGLIKPTFQKNNTTNYIYVMVPFRN